MSIKDKPLKKIHSDIRVTIDAIHNNIVDGYREEIKKLEKSKSSKNTKNIDKQISNYNDKINEYYLDNALLLNEYYENTKGAIINNSNKNNIMDFFNKTEPQKETNNNNIISTYLSKIDDNFIDENLEKIEKNIYNCKKCGSNSTLLNQYDSEIICKKCNHTEKIMINNDNIYNKDVCGEINYFSYKRINHFNEWLAQFQAKETTEIPNEVYKGVLNELNKHININKNNINNKQVKDILKKLKFNKYYEHIPNIINTLTNQIAPILTYEYEELLRNMFKEIQTPFYNNCPEDRKNFLSYSYVLHKFCQLLELDHLLKHFPLLKSREKLHQQDKIWELICKDLQWEYIPSI